MSDFCLKTPRNQGVFTAALPFKSNKRSHSGDNEAEDPPVPIPNTEVKLCVAESTIRDTVWEDRELPDFNQNDRFSSEKRSFFYVFDTFSLVSICAVSARVDINFRLIFTKITENFDVLSALRQSFKNC